jgi:hypothetical protein
MRASGALSVPPESGVEADGASLESDGEAKTSLLGVSEPFHPDGMFSDAKALQLESQAGLLLDDGAIDLE